MLARGPKFLLWVVGYLSLPVLCYGPTSLLVLCIQLSLLALPTYTPPPPLPFPAPPAPSPRYSKAGAGHPLTSWLLQRLPYVAPSCPYACCC
jgi:hypothetical protein